MISLNIGNSHIRIRDLKEEDLQLIFKWYNMADEFRFATGFDEPVWFDELENMYAGAILQVNVFFAGIYNENDIMIGMLNGRIIADSKSRLWISVFAIDPVYRRKGYGSTALNMLIEHFAARNISSIYIAVAEENTGGKRFWERQYFQEIKKIEHTRMRMGGYRDIVIMRRELV